jgi:hypothetical protein
MLFIYVSDLHEEEPMDKNSKRKKVHEDLHFIYMTYCREVKGREIVKEEIRRVKTGRASPWRVHPGRAVQEKVTFCQKGRESNQRHGNAEKE